MISLLVRYFPLHSVPMFWSWYHLSHWHVHTIEICGPDQLSKRFFRAIDFYIYRMTRIILTKTRFWSFLWPTVKYCWKFSKWSCFIHRLTTLRWHNNPSWLWLSLNHLFCFSLVLTDGIIQINSFHSYIYTLQCQIFFWCRREYVTCYTIGQA